MEGEQPRWSGTAASALSLNLQVSALVIEEDEQARKLRQILALCPAIELRIPQIRITPLHDRYLSSPMTDTPSRVDTIRGWKAFLLPRSVRLSRMDGAMWPPKINSFDEA